MQKACGLLPSCSYKAAALEHVVDPQADAPVEVARDFHQIAVRVKRVEPDILDARRPPERKGSS